MNESETLYLWKYVLDIPAILTSTELFTKDIFIIQVGKRARRLAQMHIICDKLTMTDTHYLLYCTKFISLCGLADH